MTSEISERIGRLYSAVGATSSPDLSQVRARIVPTGMEIDFSAGASPAELSNAAHTAIHAVGHLGDHIRKWARASGHDPSAVSKTVDGSYALQVIIDLSANDKHGYPPRDGGRSRVAPRLTRVFRMLQMQAGPGIGSTASVIYRFDGTPPKVEGGRVLLVISGEVVDKQGRKLPELAELLTDAIAAWEALLVTYRVVPEEPSGGEDR